MSHENEFRGNTMHTNPNTPGTINFTFTIVDMPMEPTTPRVTPLEVANAITAIAQAKGYEKVLFTGPGPRLPVNP
ncbi:hypothetical protein [Streptomyces sp. NPDC048057]|uniref:hypothetical protein n=1 Tax=Streptomyces sp. NPDC048057 TaxID=3155628 RepID=UPI0033C5AFFE